MHVYEGDHAPIVTCLQLFILLVLAPPQPAVTMERALMGETPGEIIQNDSSDIMC